LRDAIRFVIELATVDSNLAQALRPNFGLVEGLLAAHDNEADRKRWFGRLLAGHIIGNGGVERGGKQGAIQATIVRHGDHYLVNGTKYYSTGGLYADWVSSIALDEAGKETHFTVPRERAGMDLDDFDTIGQRLTASGTTRFTNMRVETDGYAAAFCRVIAATRFRRYSSYSLPPPRRASHAMRSTMRSGSRATRPVRSSTVRPSARWMIPTCKRPLARSLPRSLPPKPRRYVRPIPSTPPGPTT
jgi:hypothetical protein